MDTWLASERYDTIEGRYKKYFFLHFPNPGAQHDKADLKHRAVFPPQSTPSKRRVESYRIYKRPYFACSQSSRPSPSSYKKATEGKLVGPTLNTPRGDKYYN